MNNETITTAVLVGVALLLLACIAGGFGMAVQNSPASIMARAEAEAIRAHTDSTRVLQALAIAFQVSLACIALASIAGVGVAGYVAYTLHVQRQELQQALAVATARNRMNALLRDISQDATEAQ